MSIREIIESVEPDFPCVECENYVRIVNAHLCLAGNVEPEPTDTCRTVRVSAKCKPMRREVTNNRSTL